MFAGTFLYEPSFVNGLRGFHPYGVSVTASNQKTQQKRPTKKKDTSDDCSSAALAAPRHLGRADGTSPSPPASSAEGHAIRPES